MTRCRVASVTVPVPFNTYDTVAVETSASAATCLIVAAICVYHKSCRMRVKRRAVNRLSAETIKRSISGCGNLVKILSLYKRALIAYNYYRVSGNFLLLFGGLSFGQD